MDLACVDADPFGSYFDRLMPVRVKICGITNLEDALAAVDFGANALGFIFFSGSPRHISVDPAAEIISALPPFISKVGVFVDSPVDGVLDIAGATGIDTIQLHGSESPADCVEIAASKLTVVKAFRIKEAASLDSLETYRGTHGASAFLLDSYVSGQLGGTGAKFNWDLAVKAKLSGTPIILAGGLDPENVSDAVSKVAPYAVDVSSGVEISPGKKDHNKVRRFISQAKRTAA